MSRNYKVVDLVGGCVVIESGGRRLADLPPAEFGLEGLSRSEQAIVRRGLTAAGYNRHPEEQPGCAECPALDASGECMACGGALCEDHEDRHEAACMEAA